MKRIAKVKQLHLSSSPLSIDLLAASKSSSAFSSASSASSGISSGLASISSSAARISSAAVGELPLSAESAVALALAIAAREGRPSLSAGADRTNPSEPVVSAEEVSIPGWIGMRGEQPMLQVTLNVSDAESAEFAAWAAHTAPLSDASRRRLYTAVEAQTAAFIRAVDAAGYFYGSVATVAVRCSADGVALAWSRPVTVRPSATAYSRPLEARVEQTTIRDGMMRVTLYLSRAALRLQSTVEEGCSLYSCRYSTDHTSTPKIAAEVSAAGSADAAHVFRFETQTPPILPYFDLISKRLSAPRPFYPVDDTEGTLILSGVAGFTPQYGSSLRPDPTYSVWVEDYPLYAADDRLWILLPSIGASTSSTSAAATSATATSSLPDAERVLWDSHIPAFMPGEPLISSRRRWGRVKQVVSLPRSGNALPLLLFAENGIYLFTLTPGIEGGFTAKVRYLRPMGEDIRIPADGNTSVSNQNVTSASGSSQADASTSTSIAMSLYTQPFSIAADYITGINVSTPSLHPQACYRLEGSVDGRTWHSVCTFTRHSGMLCAPGFRWWCLRITVPDITLPLGVLEVQVEVGK